MGNLEEEYNKLLKSKQEVDDKNDELQKKVTGLIQKLQEDDQSCQECFKLRLEKLEATKKVDSLTEELTQLEQSSKSKEEELSSQITKMQDTYQEGTMKKMMDEQMAKFKQLAERMQTKYIKMNDDHNAKHAVLEDKIAQYKDILKDTKSSSDLEKELEDTKEMLTEQIIKNQEKHSEELAKVKTDLTLKLNASKAQLNSEREAFKSQLTEISANSGNSEEVETLKKQLEEEKKTKKVEQSKALSFNKMVDQMQNQMDQYLIDNEKLKKDLTSSKDKEKGLEKTINMLNTQLSMTPM